MNEWTCMFSSCEIKLEYSNLFAIQPSPRLLSAELAHTQSCPGARGGERHVAGRPIRKKNPTAQPGPGQGFAPDRAADRVVAGWIATWVARRPQKRASLRVRCPALRPLVCRRRWHAPGLRRKFLCAAPSASLPDFHFEKFWRLALVREMPQEQRLHRAVAERTLLGLQSLVNCREVPALGWAEESRGHPTSRCLSSALPPEQAGKPLLGSHPVRRAVSEAIPVQPCAQVAAFLVD